MVRDIIGVATAIVVVAGLAVVVARGGETAKVLSAAGHGFAEVINAATQPVR
jgi:hypothetical protein